MTHLPTTVTEDQIDHLGHMNVRFYGVNARQGTETLLSQLGAPSDLDLRLVDVYWPEVIERDPAMRKVGSSIT